LIRLTTSEVLDNADGRHAHIFGGPADDFYRLPEVFPADYRGVFVAAYPFPGRVASLTISHAERMSLPIIAR